MSGEGLQAAFDIGSARRVRDVVQSAVPNGGSILVISNGDDALLDLPPGRGMHFPQAEDGAHAGDKPASSEAAIAHLDELRSAGAEFLLIPSGELWWLDHYREFGEYLNRNFTTVVNEPAVCVLFNLDSGARPRTEYRTPIIKADPEQCPFGANVSGHITSEKGVGEAARATIRGLKSAGIPLALNDFVDGHSVNLETEFTEFSDKNPYAVNLVHVNAETIPGYCIPRPDAPYLRGHYNIGFWFWETDAFPRKWWNRFEYLNEVWVASDFVLDSVSRVSHIPVVKIPIALPARLSVSDRSRADFGIPPDAFTAVFVFDYESVAQRKNPLAVIQAFRKAFHKSENAMLVVKSGHSAAYPDSARKVADACNGMNIRIIDEILPRADVNALIQLADCYVSLHRSEGFGLTLAEAMSLGKPVIATAYSGNMEFMNPSNSYLVKYRLVAIGGGCEPYREGVWADPDVDHAAELMRHVFENREEAWVTGRNARMDIAERLNPRRTGALMRNRLLRIAELGNIPPPPERLLEEPPLTAEDPVYRRLIERIRQVVHRKLPSAARVLVVSRGDEELLQFHSRNGAHFPQLPDGSYAGYNPADSAQAISGLEALICNGAEYLLFPETAFWWLDHYREFKRRLDESYRRIWGDSDCIIYELTTHGGKDAKAT